MVRKWRSCIFRLALAFFAFNLASGPAVFGQAMTEFGGMGALRAGAMGTGAGMSAGMGNDAVRRSYGMMMNAQQKALGAAKGAMAEQTKAIQQYWNYGVQAEAQKKWAAAEQAYKYALQTISARDGQKSTTNVPVLERLVSTSKAEKKMDQAIDFQKMIVNLFQGEKKPDYKSVVKSRQDLSNLFVQKQDYKSAEPILRDTVAMCDTNHNVSSEQRSVIMNLYGSVLRKLNKNSEAEKIEAAAKNSAAISAPTQTVKTSAPVSQPATQPPMEFQTTPEQKPAYVPPLPDVQPNIHRVYDPEMEPSLPSSSTVQTSPSTQAPLNTQASPSTQAPLNTQASPSTQVPPSQVSVPPQTTIQNIQTKTKEQKQTSKEVKAKAQPTKESTSKEVTKETSKEVSKEAKPEVSPAETTRATETTTLEKTTSEEAAKQTTTSETQAVQEPSKESTPSEVQTTQESAKQSTTEEKSTAQETSKQETTIETASPKEEVKQATSSEKTVKEEVSKEEANKTSTTSDSAKPSETSTTTTEKTTTEQSNTVEKSITPEATTQPTDTTQSPAIDAKDQSESKQVTSETSNTETQKTDK